jgi:hypothetical protein
MTDYSTDSLAGTTTDSKDINEQFIHNDAAAKLISRKDKRIKMTGEEIQT